jgi:hypothetical protein
VVTSFRSPSFFLLQEFKKYVIVERAWSFCLEHFVLPGKVREVLLDKQTSGSLQLQGRDALSLYARLRLELRDAQLKAPLLPKGLNKMEKQRFGKLLMSFLNSVYSPKSPFYVKLTADHMGLGVFWRGRAKVLHQEGPMLESQFLWGCGLPMAEDDVRSLKADCAGAADYSLYKFSRTAKGALKGDMVLVGLASLLNAGDARGGGSCVLGFSSKNVRPRKQGMEHLSKVPFCHLFPIVQTRLQPDQQIFASYSVVSPTFPIVPRKKRCSAAVTNEATSPLAKRVKHTSN